MAQMEIPMTNITDVIDNVLERSEKMGGVEQKVEDIQKTLLNNELGVTVGLTRELTFNLTVKPMNENAFRTPILILVGGQYLPSFDMIILHALADENSTNFYKSLCGNVTGVDVTLNEDGSKNFIVHLAPAEGYRTWYGVTIMLYSKKHVEVTTVY